MKLAVFSRYSLWLACAFAGTGAFAQGVDVGVDVGKRLQTIDNIGSSTGYHGDYIAREWDRKVVDEIADLLLSREFDANGRPKGLGLSSFRMQIGAGSTGEASGIRDVWRRTDCFLRPDGSYDWTGQGIGTTYWRKKSQEYGVEVTIGFMNSAPVYYTKNGYGFKTDKEFTSNLKEEHYGDFAEFLARVTAHYQSEGMAFTYICPVNEPQHDWFDTPGKAKQEGSPWKNSEVAQLVRLTDKAFAQHNIKDSLMLIPEAASLDALAKPRPNSHSAAAGDQIAAFWQKNSPDFVGNLKYVSDIAAGHAYFSEANIKRMIRIRDDLREAVAKSDTKIQLWQTEYSLLGDGFTGGLLRDKVDEMRGALLLARVIHADFTIANVEAWQWWSSTEPLNHRIPRFSLIGTDRGGKETYRVTKLFWTLGHYSRFIRPGAQRVQVESKMTLEEQLESVMVSAFYHEKNDALTMVLVNFTEKPQEVNIDLRNRPAGTQQLVAQGFRTTAKEDMTPIKIDSNKIAMPAKSIITIVSAPADSGLVATTH